MIYKNKQRIYLLLDSGHRISQQYYDHNYGDFIDSLLWFFSIDSTIISFFPFLSILSIFFRLKSWSGCCVFNN